MDRGRLILATASLYLGASCLIASCTYLQSASRQSEYSRIHATNPSQENLKHMLDRQSFIVYGRILSNGNSDSGLAYAVAAFSNRYTDNELVSSTYVDRVNTHYSLNLPEGVFEILVFADLDRNGIFSEAEVMGRQKIDLNVNAYPQMVVGNVDVQLSTLQAADWTINITAPKTAQSRESLFYPKGTLRNLSDPLFDSDISALGLYEPAAFLEKAPTMFYALEEDSFRAPIIFVHGISGSARDFETIVSRLDSQLYKPWFFYYPSGGDLDQMAEIFYNIFLSGKAVPSSKTPMFIVAHSMGGLVAREALNKYQGTEDENRVALLLTIATPFGGHPSAAIDESLAPLVLPSWRDLSPRSVFIKRLFRKPLPPQVSHHLIYAYANPKKLKLGENSDGVVPLSSQLSPLAQRQASKQFGVNASHTGVLTTESTVQRIIQSIDEAIGDDYPEAHLKALIAGGFDIELDDGYTDREKHFIHTMGHFMSQLANGALDTLEDPVLEHFVMVARGKAAARTDPETAWIKFSRDYPHYAK